jgi:hypothetical protein
LGNEFLGKKGEKPSEEKMGEEKPEPKENPKPKPKPKPFHCEHCGRDEHLAEFCFRKKREERLAREWPTRTDTALLVVCLSLGWYQEVREWCVPSTLVGGVSMCLEVSHHIEKVVGVLGLSMVSLLDVLFAHGQYEYGGNDRSFRSQRSYEPRSPLRGMRSPPMGRVGVPPRRDRMDFANPTFEQMARHWFDSFCTNPVLSPLLTLALVFDFAGGRLGGFLVDRLRLLLTDDQRSMVVLQPHPGDDQGVHHFWG